MRGFSYKAKRLKLNGVDYKFKLHGKFTLKIFDYIFGIYVLVEC